MRLAFSANLRLNLRIVLLRESLLMPRLFIIALFCLLVFTPAAAQTNDLPQPERVAYDEDLPSEQTLAIYLPQNAEPPYPTVITIHGGGFFDGNLRTLAPLVRRFQSNGYAVVNITYRLVPNNIYPTPVEDAFCALAWVGENADAYGFDLTRIAVLGESAGGYLAARLSADDDPMPYLTACPSGDTVPALHAAILYYPIIDFLADDFQPVGGALSIGLLEGRRGLPDDSNRDAVAALSAIRSVDGSEPPTLLIHGERDRLVPPTQALLWAEALAAVDVRAELRLIPDADHGFAAQVGRGAGAEAVEAALRFLGEN